MSRKLYVGNLPYETGETELQELFGRAGNVETVRAHLEVCPRCCTLAERTPAI
jgi:RNA recognition motif-containing protein